MNPGMFKELKAYSETLPETLPLSGSDSTEFYSQPTSGVFS